MAQYDEEDQGDTEEPTAQPIPPVDMGDPAVKDAMINQYVTQAMDMSKVAEQQKRADRTADIAGWGQAIANTFNPKGAEGNAQFFGGMRNAADQKVAQAVQNRTLAGQNMAIDQQAKQFAHVNALNDPESPESNAVRESYRSMFPKIANGMENFDSLSASDINQFMSKPMELKNAADSRLAVAEENRKARRERENILKGNKEAIASDKEEQDLDKELERLDTRIKGSVRDTLGAEKKKLYTSIHGMALVDKPPEELTPMEINELGGVLAAQVTQGSPAMQTLEHMTPSTFKQDMANALGYITGKPVKVGTPEYVQLMKGMLQRQMTTSEEIIKGEVGQALAAHPKLLARRRDAVNDYLAAAGAKLDDKGQIVAYMPAAAQQKETPRKQTGESGTAYAAPAPATPADQKAIDWLNDPANAGDPHYGNVKKALQRKGLLR